MQIVIGIEDDWEKKFGKMHDDDIASWLYQVIRNGTVLPKGHGRLIDGDVMKNKLLYSHDIAAEIEILGTDDVIEYLFNDAPTIVEADKE